MSGLGPSAAEAQRRASDPLASAWVTASAGTGKTKVLTDRVLRLLLGGTLPGRILCLTFTRAAAAEMANRLHETLSRWAVLKDERLAEALAELTGETATAGQLDTARRLFAAVLDVPGGLKIMTIHAFCQSLLARFPLEAGIAPHFAPMDERTEAEVLARTRADVLTRLKEGEAPPRAIRAFAMIGTELDERRFNIVLHEMIRERARLKSLAASPGGLPGLADILRGRLGLAPGVTSDALLLAASQDTAFDGRALGRLLPALAGGSATDKRRAALIGSWLEATPTVRAERIDAYATAYLTAEGELSKRLVTKAIVDRHPDAADVLAAEGRRLIDVLDGRKAANVVAMTDALIHVGLDAIDRYERLKRSSGRLDYDDLVLGAAALLREPDVVPWVLYKLDGGIDHVLVDEAQDTSPEQWRVITALIDEFFAGIGASETIRTIFSVGDPKQSIFSFQRADPRYFGAMRDRFAERAQESARDWRAVALDLSFRSTEAVLQAVDAVFAGSDAGDGVVEPGVRMHHLCHRSAEPGVVEVWPVAPVEEGYATPPWDPPVVRRESIAPRTRLARLIAKRIHGWVLSDHPPADAMLESRGRRIAAGDIMILVRRRDAFVELLVRELKALGVPVAGVDRLVLTEQLAVMDLVALGQVLLLPEDDLTLATVLKGPLVGLDEDELFALAHGRQGTLWAALEAGSAGSPGLLRAHGWLSALRARADYVRPYELFAEVLGQGGRARLVARLGPDANDPIDEFLSLALAYEQSAAPSLQGFLHWLHAGEVTVKRELDQARGAVRVMTVHGAKGLQAPIVIMPDTVQPPESDDTLLWFEDCVLWVPKRSSEDRRTAAFRAAARERRDKEYRRLLYVAMTRAEDRLYVSGWETRRSASDRSWYHLVRRGLDGIAEPVRFDFQGDDVHGWSGDGLRLNVVPRGWTAPAVREPARVAPEKLPDWAKRPPPEEPPASKILAPSRLDGDPPVRAPLEGGDSARFERGLIIHRLLQFLPDMAPEARAAAAARFLARRVFGLSPAEQSSIGREVLAVLAAPELSDLFGEHSRAEVPLIGRAGHLVISGQVDRLAVTGGTVTVADYKTNRRPPEAQDQVAPGILRQMACYRSLLREVYPGTPVRAVLIWTDGPKVMILSDKLLERWAP
ncbi:MAG: double-strand break repair helicase AddA [Alphaproteobacteria bacterium]